MNERIKELEERCWEELGEEECYYTVFNREKFAEFIINECIKCCGEIDDINKAYREGLFLDPELGPKECINTIKEHFGVEE